MAPSIPDRWLKYKPVGEPIAGTRFIAFKVPLREHVISSVPENQRLGMETLLKHIPKLGMIIDLTNTTRYYDAKFFEDQGINYVKLMIPGHQTPSTHLVKKFKEYVKSFLNKNPNNAKLIGVHCTHGVNRTGYLICNYMISEMSMRPEDAIIRFAAARGHQIERENYLNALKMLPVKTFEKSVRKRNSANASKEGSKSPTSAPTSSRYVTTPTTTVPSANWRIREEEYVQAADILHRHRNLSQRQADTNPGCNYVRSFSAHVESQREKMRIPWNENPYNSIDSRKVRMRSRERLHYKDHVRPGRNRMEEEKDRKGHLRGSECICNMEMYKRKATHSKERERPEPRGERIYSEERAYSRDEQIIPYH